MTLSRREFVRGAAAWTAALAPAWGLLQGCGRGGDEEAGTGGGSRALGDLEGELNIYNWSDYIDPETIAGFEREFGVRVSYHTFESLDEMLGKYQAGALRYDLLVPSDDIIAGMITEGRLRPLDVRYLPNWTNLAPQFTSLPFDPRNRYSMSWQWGTTGIAYRRDKVATPPTSWAAFFDSRYAGRMTQLDEARDVIGSMLRYRGHSLSSTDTGELTQARADSLRARALLRGYISAPVKEDLVSGEVWLAQLWNGDTGQAKREDPAIEFVMPREGGLIWTDCLVIPAESGHPRAAHEFMNYLLRPDVAARVADYTHCGSPNAAAQRLMEVPIPYPDAAQLERLEFRHDLGAAAVVWDQIWAELKSA